MKDQKYMIGNLAMSIKFAKAVRLTLQDFADANQYADGSSSLEWFKNNVIPIELKMHHFCNLDIKVPYQISLVERSGIPSYFFWSWDTGLQHPIKYVHELQNWYHLLSNGKELRVVHETSPEPKRLTGLSHNKSITTDLEFIYSHELKYAKIRFVTFTRKTVVVYFTNIETGASGDMQFETVDAPELAELLKSKF